MKGRVKNMRNHHQRPTNNDHATKLRAMTFADAARAGYSFRWNRQRRLLELTTTHAGWRSIREMADYNRRVDYTTRFFARVEAAIQRNSK